MLRRLGVRYKILATLAVPVLALILAVVLISTEAISQSRESRAARDFVAGLDVLRELGAASSTERILSLQYIEADRPGVGELADEGGDPTASEHPLYEQLEESRVATDAALAKYQAHIDSLDFSQYDSSVAAASQASREARGGVSRLRYLIDTTYSLNGATAAFNDFAAVHLGEFRALAAAIPDRQLARELNATMDLIEYTDKLTMDGPFSSILLDVRQQGDDPQRAAEALLVELMRDSNNARAQATSTLEVLGHPDLEIPLRDQTFSARRSLVMSGGFTASLLEVQEEWEQAYMEEIAFFQELNLRASAITEETAQSSATNARNQAIITVAIAILAVLISLLVALLIARLITEPLRRLTSAAENVREELPNLVQQVAVPGQGPDLTLASVPVESNDEVGQLARVFNSVNETTIEVAQEQAALRGSIAEMFVNVARRDQVLLNRQLGFLDELERNEEDPGALADLFRLDHLATRMRRNAESLLILAGIDTGRRIRDAMPLSDVVRTATSEIELYDRVYLEIIDDPMMMGHTALNAAHLLAEILENATQFSDPTSRVEVTTRDAGDVVEVIVRDYGLGMSDEEIAEANRRASQAQASEILGSQHLGLYVVGRLANRLDANVMFYRPDDGQGTVAVVHLPHPLFTKDSASALSPVQEQSYSQLPSADQAMDFADDYKPITIPDAYQPEIIEEAAPLAVREVDLDALTDGQTSTGMPRRKAGQQASPGAPVSPTAPSPAPAADLVEEDVVLPPLLTPQLDDEDLGDTFAWTAPQPVLGSGSSLPSRRRPAADAVPPPVPVEASEDTPATTGPGRTSLFSSFRGRETLAEVSDSAANAEPAIDDSVPSGPEVAALTPPPTLATPESAVEPEASTPESAAPEVTWPPPPAPPGGSPAADELPAFPTRRARHMANVPPDTGATSRVSPEDEELPPFPPIEAELPPVAFPAIPRLEDDPAEALQPESVEPEIPTLEPDDTAAPGLTSFDDVINADSDDSMAVEPAWAETTPGFAPLPTYEPVDAIPPVDEFDIGHEDLTPPATAVPVRDSVLTPPPAPASEPAPQAGGADDSKTPFWSKLFGRKKVDPKETEVVAPAWQPPSSPEEGQVPAWLQGEQDALQSDAVWMPASTPASAVSAPPPPTETEPTWPPAAAPEEPSWQAEASWQPQVEQRAETPLAQRNDAWSAPAADTQTGWSMPVFDDEAQERLRTASGIQEQAMAELSQLSSYRPQRSTSGSGSLAKRVPSQVPSTTSEEEVQTGAISRDAAQLRARLSAFQSATSRAREEATGPGEHDTPVNAASGTHEEER